jgi:hypothetical protein
MRLVSRGYCWELALLILGSCRHPPIEEKADSDHRLLYNIGRLHDFESRFRVDRGAYASDRELASAKAQIIEGCPEWRITINGGPAGYTIVAIPKTGDGKSYYSDATRVVRVAQGQVATADSMALR